MLGQLGWEISKLIQTVSSSRWSRRGRKLTSEASDAANDPKVPRKVPGEVPGEVFGQVYWLQAGKLGSLD